MPSIVELATSFSLGVAANLNPCVLPLYPGFLSYISSQPDIVDKKRFTHLSGFLVLGGVILFMVIVGGVTAGFGLSITNFVSTVSPVAFTILIVVGFLLIFDVSFDRLYFILPQAQAPRLKNPYASAFGFGFLYGPIVIPCNAPLVFAVFAYSVGISGFLAKFSVLMAFGLGLGVPLLILSWMSTARGSWLIRKFVDHHTTINRVAGTLLVLLGIYELVFVFGIFS